MTSAKNEGKGYCGPYFRALPVYQKKMKLTKENEIDKLLREWSRQEDGHDMTSERHTRSFLSLLWWSKTRARNEVKAYTDLYIG